MHSSWTYQHPPLCPINLCWMRKCQFCGWHVIPSFPYFSYWLVWLQRNYSESCWIALLCNRLSMAENKAFWILMITEVHSASQYGMHEFQYMVPPEHNVALTHMSQFSCDSIIAEKRSIALISLASIHPYKCLAILMSKMDATPHLLNNDSIMSKPTRASKHDVALGWYHT